MAKDEDKTTVEVKDGKDGEEESKKGMSKLILFGGIGGGIVILGVVLALFVLKPMMADSDGADELDEGDHTEQVEGEKATETKKKKKKKRKKKSAEHGEGEEQVSLIYAIKDIVVNPAGTGGTRFLSVSFGFELESQELATEFEGRELLVRDALITILSSKTIAELTNAKQKEIIRYQVKKRLSNLLDTDEIEGVYYTDFVLQ